MAINLFIDSIGAPRTSGCPNGLPLLRVLLVCTYGGIRAKLPEASVRRARQFDQCGTGPYPSFRELSSIVLSESGHNIPSDAAQPTGPYVR